MQEQAIDGGGAAGLAEAFGHDAVQGDAQLGVMHERFGGHRVVAGIADALARAADGLLATLERPTETLGGGSVGVEEQTLRVGRGDRLAGVG